MNKTATRTHTTGGILFLLTGIAHSIGQFSADHSPLAATAEQTLRSYIIPDAGFSYWDILQSWGALYGAMTFLFGALLLAIGHWTAHEPRAHRVTATAGAITAAVQATLSLAFHTPPPAFFMIPCVVLFTISAVKGRE
jgi:hypothetical protein